MMRRSHAAAVISSFAMTVALATACGSTDDAVKASEKAAADAAQASKKAAADAADASKKAAAELADKAADSSKKTAIELADKAADSSKKAADELVDATKSGAKALYDDLRNDGELSDSAKEWLKAQASDESTIEGVLVKGVQLAPVALEASMVLADAVDTETALEPIFQKVDSDTGKTDAAIGGMPRVEVVDGLTVGFKQMDTLDASKKVEQRGYLVIWRHEDHLVGFVYRSTRTIDIERLVAETPRLVKLTQKALDD
jgi:hypothetical protein